MLKCIPDAHAIKYSIDYFGREVGCYLGGTDRLIDISSGTQCNLSWRQQAEERCDFSACALDRCQKILVRDVCVCFHVAAVVMSV